jgi:hypothetical protein
MTTSPQSCGPQQSELPSRTRIIAAISARPHETCPPPNQYQDMTPSQKLATAWNIIQNVRADLDKDDYERTNIILQVLDEILLNIHPCVTDEPVPLPYTHCWNCCGNDR